MSLIPIQNIYYIFCYAWQRFEIGQQVSTNVESGPGINELFAKVLINAVKSIIRKGLDRDYSEHLEDLNGPKGRIIFADTVKRNLLHQMRTHCSYDELSHDNIQNQILKSTLYALSLSKDLNKELKDEARSIALKMHDISMIRIRPSDFRYVKIHRNNAYYDFLMKVCELINSSLLPDKTNGTSRFSDFINNEERMGLVFEDFIRNFYLAEQTTFQVRSEELKWGAVSENEQDLSYLPKMKTDISLSSATRKIIIDTKFYKETLQSYMGSEKIRSSHLYQISSYLDNDERNGGIQAEGILLYPTVSKSLDLNYKMRHHNIRIYTLNLNQEWKAIRSDLLSLIN